MFKKVAKFVKKCKLIGEKKMFKKVAKFVKKCLFIKEKSKPDLTIYNSERKPIVKCKLIDFDEQFSNLILDGILNQLKKK